MSLMVAQKNKIKIKMAWCCGIQQISPENNDGPTAIWPSVSVQEALIKVLKRARLY